MTYINNFPYRFEIKYTLQVYDTALTWLFSNLSESEWTFNFNQSCMSIIFYFKTFEALMWFKFSVEL